MIAQVVDAAKIAGVIEEAHWEGHNILASTLAQQAHHLHLEEEVELPMTLNSLQVDIKANYLGNLNQVVPSVQYGN